MCSQCSQCSLYSTYALAAARMMLGKATLSLVSLIVVSQESIAQVHALVHQLAPES